jgi:hypothetical protein
MKSGIINGKFYIQKWYTKELLFMTYRVTTKEAVQNRRSKLEIVYDNVFARGR